MIDVLSRTLKKILKNAGGGPLSDADISFKRPADSFSPERTTVGLFLYDVREDLGLRSNEPMIERGNGIVITNRPPFRVACSYLITAWPGSGAPPEEADLQEQELLSRTLQVLSGHTLIKADHLGNKVEPPWPMATALVDPQKNMSEFWTALGGKLRPSLTVSVTISMPHVLKDKPTEMVTARKLKLGERTSPDAEEIALATLEELILIGIGGRVTNAASEPVSGATITLKELGLRTTTDIEGRYKLSVRLPGQYTLHVQKGERSKEISVTVEAGSQTEVQLT